jgi:hypothetical protein
MERVHGRYIWVFYVGALSIVRLISFKKSTCNFLIRSTLIKLSVKDLIRDMAGALSTACVKDLLENQLPAHCQPIKWQVG